MEKSYSIDEILSAVEVIQNKNKKKDVKFTNKIIKKDYSAVPKDTLKLIEEAEKLKNK
mgnify:CR=1 FL=1|jgi:hypothetical protein|tara:strand:+ start:157 stop:330 length:174 start_codon:yes stop_codon:yes gene_type:complete